MSEQSLQDRFFPQGRCYGCGPANEEGLRLKSYAVDERTLEATWTPKEFHLAFPGILNGGIIGTLLDCHSTIASWWAFFITLPEGEPFAALTAEYTIRLLKPTPVDEPLSLIGRVVELTDRRATVEGTLTAAGETTATSSGIFVRPKEPFALQ
jgi:acyl-coenzyme A thioesterase PaaI-like protein